MDWLDDPEDAFRSKAQERAQHDTLRYQRLIARLTGAGLLVSVEEHASAVSGGRETASKSIELALTPTVISPCVWSALDDA
ncbi:MAG: hypothetical protein WBY44_14900 [Bryobacteraceae bacterium]